MTRYQVTPDKQLPTAVNQMHSRVKRLEHRMDASTGPPTLTQFNTIDSWGTNTPFDDTWALATSGNATGTYSLPGGDASGTIYRIVTSGYGQQGATAGTISFNIYAYEQVIAPVVIAASVVPSNACFSYSLEAQLQVQSFAVADAGQMIDPNPYSSFAIVGTLKGTITDTTATQVTASNSVAFTYVANFAGIGGPGPYYTIASGPDEGNTWDVMPADSMVIQSASSEAAIYNCMEYFQRIPNNSGA